MSSKPSDTLNESFLKLYAVGLKLKALRMEKRLTLSSLAVETGYSTALLSKLETGRMVPTFPTLSRICRVYGVDLGYFFSSVPRHSLSITRKAHLDSRRKQPVVNLTPLHAPTTQGKQVSRIVDIPAGITWILQERGATTELTAYVLEGALRLNTAGTEELLRAGDCIVLNTQQAVLWNAPDSRCRVLAVFSQ